MEVTANLEASLIRGRYRAEGGVVLRGAVVEEVRVSLKGGHVHSVPRHDAAAHVGEGFVVATSISPIVLVNAVRDSHFVGFPRYGLEDGPNFAGGLPRRLATDEIDADVAIGVDIGPMGIRISGFGVFAFDVDFSFP